MATTGLTEAIRPTRVLVFAVDDAGLCVDLNRVDAVGQRGDVPVHTLKAADGAGRSFLIHRGEPALLVDLREAVGLNDILGPTDRPGFLVMRAGSFPLALPVDAFLGVRDLDLHTKTPVPTALQRDGGFCVGHLIELDGRVHSLLEPSRVLGSALREALDPFLKEAQAFCEREKQIAALETELRRDPSVTRLRTYARLTRRNGHAPAAAAARLVLKAAQQSTPHTAALVAGELAADMLLRDLLSLSAARQNGQVYVQLPDNTVATIVFTAGQIADATIDGVRGRAALKQVLAAHDGSYRFVVSDTTADPQRVEDAAPWVLVECIKQLHGERRGRHAR